MVLQYSTQYTNKPAPFIFNVKATTPQNDSSIMLNCWLDSGATITCLPLSVITNLNLLPCDEIEVTGYGDQTAKRTRTYLLKLNILDVDYDVTVITSPRTYGLIGLDILNKWKLILDGRNLQFDIQ